MNLKLSKSVFIVFLLFSGIFIYAGTEDSLKTVVKNSTNPENKFKSVVSLFHYYIDEKSDKSTNYLNELEMAFKALKKPSPEFEAVYFLNKAQYFNKGNSLDSAFVYSKKARNSYEYLKSEKGMIDASFVLENCFNTYGQYDSLEKYALKTVELSRKINNKKHECEHLLMLTTAYNNLGKRTQALASYKRTIELSKEIKYHTNTIQTLVSLSYFYNSIDVKYSKKYLSEANEILPLITNNAKEYYRMVYSAWGNVYNFSTMPDSALYFFNRSIALMDTSKDLIAYAAATGNIGDIYSDKGDFKKAIEQHQKSLILFARVNDKLDMAVAYGSIADNYLKQKDYVNAIKYYKSANEIANEIKSTEQLIYNYSGIADCYESIGDFKNAYANFKLYKQCNDSLNNIGNAKKLTEQELKYQFEMKEKEEKILQKSKDQITQEQIKRQKLTIYASLIGGIVLLVFLVVSVRNSNIRKRINKQLELSHFEIKQQKNIIETKNREITDSITYASRLQQGILPDADEVKQLLPGSFIFYRPRDIVSGDFYWIRKLDGNSKVGTKDSVAVVIADCTGHGVPGAFMSFIGSTILNQTLGNKKVQTPSDALQYLNEQLPLTLQSKTKTGQINDGMEAGIFVFDKSENKLFFAGANLNLIHIRDNVVQEIKGDKHPIGINIELRKTFTTHEISLQKNDCIYMFSDGYPDQFGGPKGKKYKYKNLVNFLVSNSSLNAEEQLQNLSQNFDHWKGQLEQLDDVLVFGIKV